MNHTSGMSQGERRIRITVTPSPRVVRLVEVRRLKRFSTGPASNAGSRRTTQTSPNRQKMTRSGQRLVSAQRLSWLATRSPSGGLPATSVVKCEELQPIHRDLIHPRPIGGPLAAERMAEGRSGAAERAGHRSLTLFRDCKQAEPNRQTHLCFHLCKQRRDLVVQAKL